MWLFHQVSKVLAKQPLNINCDVFAELYLTSMMQEATDREITIQQGEL